MDAKWKDITEQTLEFKISYINAISFFLHQSLNKKNVENVENLINLLDLNDMQEDLLEFLKEPEADELEETFETISDYGIAYIANLLYFLDKDNFNENEKKFLEFVINKFQLSKNTVGLISSLIDAIKAEDKFKIRELSSEIVKDEELINGLENFVTFYTSINLRAEALKQKIVREFERYDFKNFSEDEFFKKNCSEIDDIVKDDVEFIAELSKYSNLVFRYFTTEKSNNKELAIKMLDYIKDFSSPVTIVLEDDKDVVLEAVKNSGWALKYASKRLQDDKDVVFKAIKYNGRALKYASKRLQDDKGFILEAVENDGRALEFAVSETVENRGSALEYATKRLQDDKDVVLVAIKNRGSALEYASQRLQDDKDVVLEAVKNSGSALEYASQRLQDDKDVVLEAVKDIGWALKYASKRLQENLKTIDT